MVIVKNEFIAGGVSGWKKMIVKDFDLRLTIESGQFFRFYLCDGHYVALTKRKTLLLEQREDVILYHGADEKFVKSFLGINDKHDNSVARLENDLVISAIVRRYRGLRLMLIDLHETIIGFICSSQSNIPKIKKNLDLMAKLCGNKIGEHYFIPPPGVMLDEKTLIDAKTGYRAKYLAKTNVMLSKKFFDDIVRKNYDESHALLCELPGVGPKVSDCICLFALGHGESFPVDVHVLRAMNSLFPRSKFKDEAAARLFAQKRWGKDAGLAQQFIFQWARDDLARYSRRDK